MCFVIFLSPLTARNPDSNNTSPSHTEASSVPPSDNSGRDLQLIYEALFAVWLLSFNADIAEKDFTGTPIVLNVVRLLREVDKEKIRRVGLATLRNLVWFFLFSSFFFI